MYSMYSTGKEIRERDMDTVVLPVGSTEQHAGHLPIATDALIADMLADGVAERLDALRLPTVPYTTSQEHRGKKGSFWVSTQVLYSYLESLMESIHYQGFKKVVMLFTHGGILFTEAFVRDMNMKFEDMHIIMVKQSKAIKDNPDLLETPVCIHACESETSLMMYKYPQYVREEEIVDYVPEVHNDYMNLRSIFTYSPTGVWGQPSYATKEKGKKLLEAMIDSCVEQAQEQFEKGFGEMK